MFEFKFHFVSLLAQTTEMKVIFSCFRDTMGRLPVPIFFIYSADNQPGTPPPSKYRARFRCLGDIFHFLFGSCVMPGAMITRRHIQRMLLSVGYFHGFSFHDLCCVPFFCGFYANPSGTGRVPSVSLLQPEPLSQKNSLYKYFLKTQNNH